MRLDKLAITAQEAFQSAMGIAGDADTQQIDSIHLLKALLDSGENNLSAIVKRVGADPEQLRTVRRSRAASWGCPCPPRTF